MDDLARMRGWYAQDLRLRTPVRRNLSVVEAFAAVPRENFLGPGPWRILPDANPREPFTTPDDVPHWLYHDVLVTIDPERQLNNGMPSFWAHNLDHLDLQRGERVLQVGAGTGYYTAVLAEIVGPRGRVTAVEYDEGLAARARANLAPWRQVEVLAGDGRAHDPGEVDAVVVFAGVDPSCPALARPPGRRRPAGHAADLEDWWGFMLRAIRRGDGIRRQRDRLGRNFPLRGRTRRGCGRKARAGAEGRPQIRLGDRTAVPHAAARRAGTGRRGVVPRPRVLARARATGQRDRGRAVAIRDWTAPAASPARTASATRSRPDAPAASSSRCRAARPARPRRRRARA